jgi:hypothetical protein
LYFYLYLLKTHWLPFQKESAEHWQLPWIQMSVSSHSGDVSHVPLMIFPIHVRIVVLAVKMSLSTKPIIDIVKTCMVFWIIFRLSAVKKNETRRLQWNSNFNNKVRVGRSFSSQRGDMFFLNQSSLSISRCMLMSEADLSLVSFVSRFDHQWPWSSNLELLSDQTSYVQRNVKWNLYIVIVLCE